MRKLKEDKWTLTIMSLGVIASLLIIYFSLLSYFGNFGIFLFGIVVGLVIMDEVKT